MKEDIGPQPESVGQPIWRYAPRLGQIADDLRIVGRVEFEQGRVMRCDGMQESKGYIAVAVVISGLDGDREFESAAAPRTRLRDSRTAGDKNDEGSDQDPESYPPACAAQGRKGDHPGRQQHRP